MPVRNVPGVLAGAVTALLFIGPVPAVHAAPVVPGYERFADAEPLRALTGPLLLTELNCVLCHQTDAGAATSARQGPVLDKVGQRVRVGYLRRFLQNPHQAKPGTTMPHLL